MKLFILIQAFYTACLSQPSSLLSDCSQHQPFEVVRDDGSKSASMKDISISDTYNDNNEFSVNFYLYTSENPDKPMKIQFEDKNSIRILQYDNNLPLIVIVHGWLGNINTGSAKAIKNSIVRQNYKNPCNIIMVDWSGPANDEKYINAPEKVPYVGRRVGEMLNWFIDITKSDIQKVHLIGYDLGAHVVGFAGRITDSNVGRITGLDPISPCFKDTVSSLSKADGKYVEVIHTDCAFIRSLGIIMPIGHADFYPNNCNLQPGCDSYICSHTRAYELFASSVIHDNLIGVRCDNVWDAMKANCNNTDTSKLGNIDHNKRGKGIYSLITTSQWPFSTEPKAQQLVGRGGKYGGTMCETISPQGGVMGYYKNGYGSLGG